MKLTDQLKQLADANPDIAPVLLDAIDRIELARHWREQARVLTLDLELLKLELDYRKEKDSYGPRSD
jgi:hypothetical protein